MESIHAYYSQQAQGGRGGGLAHTLLLVYAGIGVQAGHRLGNILGAAFRLLSPAIKTVGKAVLHQGTATGANILSDVIEGQPLKQSAKRRAAEGGQALVNQALARSGLIPGPPPAKKRKKTVKKGRKGGKSRQSGRGRRRVKRLPLRRRVLAKKRKPRKKRRRTRTLRPQDIFG